MGYEYRGTHYKVPSLLGLPGYPEDLPKLEREGGRQWEQ